MADAATSFDQATGGAFGLAAVTGEVLLQADANAATHPLANLAAAWIRRATWQASESFLAEHGELLSDDGRAAIGALAEASPRNDTLALHVNLLGAARRDGVAAAYAQLRAELAAQRSAAVVRDWLACAPDWPASAAYHAEHAEQLSTPEAKAILADACRREPDDPRLWLHLGLLLLGGQRPDGYASVATGDPDPLQQASALLADGEWDQALAWANLARARDRATGALVMAQAQLARQQPDQAAEALADATSHAGKDQLPIVLAAYDKLLQAQPGEPWRHAEHAAVLQRAGRQADALAAYDRAIALTPDNPSLRFNKGDLLFVLGRLDEATTEFLEVTRLRPDDVLGAQVLLGAISWPADRNEAREHFASALASPGALLAPFTRALYRAIALAGLGRVGDAERELETALPARSADEVTQDDISTLLQRLQNPPLPGLDALRRLLEPATTGGATVVR